MVACRLRWMMAVVVASVVSVALAAGQEPSSSANGDNLTEEQQADFLLHANVIASRHTGKGITSPWRLTLSDGKITHEASFQSIDQQQPEMKFPDGHTEFNFKDSYHFDIAGYELAKLVGMDNMVPVTVEREWKGRRGAVSWWVPDIAMDEGDRQAKGATAPDPTAWNQQMYKIRVFDELVFDTDPNLTNVLITKDWKIWRIDFSRAFRTSKKLRNPENLVMCDKNLLAKLKALNEDDLLAATKGQLSKGEAKAVMARRDVIVATFEKMVAQKGESAVLY